MVNIIFITALLIFVFSIALSFIINKIVINITAKKQYAQIERKYLYFHDNKKNIPILGGISIILTIIISYIIYSLIFSFDYLVLISILSLFLFGLVGFFDDLNKIRKKNSDGISPLIRLGLEAIISILCLKFCGWNRWIRCGININSITSKLIYSF